MDVLMAKLDYVFKKEKFDEACTVSSKFMSFKKLESHTRKDYILEYEHLYNKMSDHDMKFPDTIRAFKLLDGANHKDDERKMALTVASDLNQ